MAETMTATEASTKEMLATGASPPGASATGASSTGTSVPGYEAFITDSCAAANIDIKAMMEKAPSPKALTDSAQSIITTYFPPDEKAVEKKAGNDMAGEGAPPELTASSSSEGSKTKEKLSSWADKLSSQCHMDTACGRCELEFMKKEELPASKANALTEQGELLAIEGAPPPTPWTRQVSEATADTLTSVSTRASGLMVALGLAAKKDQALITDYYKADPTPNKTQKSLSVKVQELKSNARSLQASVMSTLGLSPEEKKMKSPEEKEMKQTLITTYDPNKVDQKDATAEEIADPKVEQAESADCDGILSVTTEVAGEKKEETEEKPSWNLWNKMKGFFKMLPDQTAPCGHKKVDISACEEVKVPECSDLSDLGAPTEVRTPRIEIPSFTLFSCNPSVAPEEEEIKNAEEAKAEKTDETNEVEKMDETNEVEKTEETNEVEKTEETKMIEETKVENTQPGSPKAHVPW